MTMRRLLGILMLTMVINVISATVEHFSIHEAEEDCVDCDGGGELDRMDIAENQELLTMDEKMRPPRRPYCERHGRRGWGGTCTEFTNELVGQRCDFIWNNTYNDAEKQLCFRNEQACCVDCESNTQQHICWRKRNFSIARGKCCDNELQVCDPLKSGCVCCKHCKRKRLCRHPGAGKRGFCVTEFDPVYNTTMCEEQGGRLKKRACMGIGCWCCVMTVPTEPSTPAPGAK